MTTPSSAPQLRAVATDATLQQLEYDQVLEQVAQFAGCDLGRRAVRSLRPSADRDMAVRELECVDQMRLLLDQHPGTSFSTPLTEAFSAAVAKFGMVLDPAQLLGLRDTYDTVARGRALADRLQGRDDPFIRIRIALSGLPYHPVLHRELGRVFSPKGDIKDDASDELGVLRARQRTLARRIESALDRLLRDGSASTYLAEDYFTVHSDRYVILVKADFKGKVPGVVQGESATGLSLYVEPLFVVEHNNELIETRVEEAREVRRILAHLSDQARVHAADYPRLLETLAWLDCVAARARWAEGAGASTPRFGSGLHLKLDRARHPLLGDRCVPVELELAPPHRAAIVSGVNSGGKTVALKTTGLMAAMAQAGIPVPTGPDTTLPVFDRIACEIGDQQSLAQNLSSFSSHVSHLAAILANLGRRSLLLFDEFMTGTDPEEGAALAEAILVDLASKETLAVVTTHYGALKLLVQKYPTFRNMAVEFDWQRLAPTFRLISDVPGSSLGVDIARRFGIAPELAAAARRLVDEGQPALNKMLVDLEARLQQVQRNAREVAEELEAARTERERFAVESAAKERRAAEDLAELKELHVSEMEDLKHKVHEALKVGPPRQLANELHEKIQRAAAEVERDRKSLQKVVDPTDNDSLEPGSFVKVDGMKEAGVVKEITRDRKSVRVMVHGIELKVAMDKLSPARGPSSGKSGRAPSSRTGPAPTSMTGKAPPSPPRSSGATVQLASRDMTQEVNLIGRRVEEALEALDEFLDAAVTRTYREIRIVHGKGTGALRSAVERYLTGHPAVASHRRGAYGEGDSGVTVATLK